MNSRIVIVAYKPKPNKNGELKELVKSHYARLQAENLVSERLPIIMESNDGTIIEVFEWKSEDTIKQAHTNKAVGAMWMEFNQVCEYIPIGKVAEAQNMFSEFKPVN